LQALISQKKLLSNSFTKYRAKTVIQLLKLTRNLTVVLVFLQIWELERCWKYFV